MNGAEPAAAPPPPPAPPESPAGWRPWRFRMSNDVWGTPAVDGDLVYVTSFEVHALDVATGRRRFKTRDVAWSMAVADGRIHASDGPTLFALDARAGADLWRLSTDAWVYSLQAERGTVVTGTRGGGVQAWEAANGRKLWEITGCQSDFESPEAGPALHDGTVYVWRDARLRALDARTGDERWSYPIGDAASCGGVPVRVAPAPDGYVYVTAGTRVLAVDVAAGRVRWHFEAPAVFLSPPAFAPGPAVTGGGVYLADYLGTVYALDATDGRDRWRIATEARTSVEPVLVAAGHVHVGSGTGLYTLDAVTGTPQVALPGGRRHRGRPLGRRGPDPLRRHRPPALHAQGRRRPAALEARHRRRDHRLPGGQGRDRLRVQQGPLRVRPRRGEGHGYGPHRLSAGRCRGTAVAPGARKGCPDGGRLSGEPGVHRAHRRRYSGCATVARGDMALTGDSRGDRWISGGANTGSRRWRRRWSCR
ncbi:hypothetical protein GCM10020295_47570 [Streptomyces cinereospinus]